MKSKFHPSMIRDAKAAADVLGASPLAKKLKANGVTPSAMATAARDLSDLETAVHAAEAAVVQARDALAQRANEFADFWSAYQNLVRAMTRNEAVRQAHGVSSAGVRKGPRFHRAPKTEPAATPPTPAPSKTGNA